MQYDPERRQTSYQIVLSAMDDDADVDTDVDFEKLLSERRLSDWQASADAVDLPLAEWIVVTLDRAAKVIRRQPVSDSML